MEENQPELPSKDILSDYLVVNRQQALEDANRQIRKARNTLLVVGVLTFIGNMIVLSQYDAFYGIPLMLTIGLAAVFIALGILTRHQPLAAIITGLVIYTGIWIWDIIQTDGENIIRQVIIKGIIIYFLIAAIKPAREAERIKKDIKQFSA